jgi:hypothetical protein
MIRRLRSHLPGRRFVVLPAVVFVLISGATGAWAYYISGGAGAGSGNTSTLQPTIVVAFAGGDAPSTMLYPDGGAADVILRVNNPNSFPVTLVSVTGNGTITAVGNPPGCTTTGVTFADQTSLSLVVPTGSSLLDLPGAASMSAASSNGCQGASFSIPVTITTRYG